MIPAENKTKRLSSVNHTTKTIHQIALNIFSYLIFDIKPFVLDIEKLHVVNRFIYLIKRQVVVTGPLGWSVLL